MSSRVLQDVLEHEPRVPFVDVRLVQELLDDTQRIYLYGAGRSGLVLRMFAMRLAQTGRACSVVGDATTTAITSDDQLVIASASGTTASVERVAIQARQAAARVLLLTATPDAKITQSAHHVVQLPGNSKDGSGDVGQRQPLGSLFEQLLLCFLDEVILRLIEVHRIDPSLLAANHANLE